MTLPPRTVDTMSMAIAMSSPSGRMSRRARADAEKRLCVALFGTDCDLKGERPLPTIQEKHDRLLQRAKEMRHFASQGFGPRKHLIEAIRLEAEAAALISAEAAS